MGLKEYSDNLPFVLNLTVLASKYGIKSEIKAASLLPSLKF